MCKVSVVMSTYNENIEELTQSIESILNQTFKEFEFIIILDNPQNQEHIKILNEYVNKDIRIKFFINEENIGLAKTLNKGIEIAKCKYIARMDADDISLPERLEKQYNILENNKDIDIVSTNKINIDENGAELEKSGSLPTEDKEIKRILEKMSIIVHPSVMFRKDRIEQLGKYREFPASQDYDLWLRACNENYKFYIIDEYLIKYRIRSNNISNKNPLKQWVIHEYIFKLYKQRMQKVKDNFSIEDLNKYLQKHKAFDEKEIDKFKNGLTYMQKMKNSIKDKDLFSAICYLLKALTIHRKMKNVIYNYFVSYVMKNR